MAVLSPARCRCAAVILAVALLGVYDAGSAYGQSVTEIEAKAVFLYNFTRFVEWPKTQGNPNLPPFVIGILGDDPFGRVLDRIVDGEVVDGRMIVIERYTRLAEVDDCQMLFVSRSEERYLADILEAVKGRHVLTIGESPQFARRGGNINLVNDRDRISIEINLSTATASGLIFSSNLLRVATLIAPGP